MLTKAAARIVKACEKKQKMNFEVDENGDAIIDSEDTDGENDDVVYKERLCQCN